MSHLLFFYGLLWKMSWATLRADAFLQLVVVEEIDAAFLLLSEVISAEKPDSLQ